MPTPAAAGLREGIRFVRRIGVSAVHEAECELFRIACERLYGMPGVTVYSRVPGPVLLFNIDGVPPSEVGSELDRRGICVRSGFHCAPMAHRAIGTLETGAVRASFGVMNTRRDALRFADAVREIVRETKSGV